MNQSNKAFYSLVKIMEELREKCPWDKKQTIQTLRQQTIEETYELADAITDEDWGHIKEELGDLLLHIVFYSKIAEEENQFNIEEVIQTISEKLIRRHPHVYGETKLDTAEEVKKNWEQLKLKEGRKSLLSGVPKSLPSLMKAMRIQDKAKQVGFEWQNVNDVWKKIEEEKTELEEALKEKNSTQIEQEAGDLLFSVVNYIRFLKIDADKALELTNKKFIRRFTIMEQQAAEKGWNLNEFSLPEMNQLWNEIKEEEKRMNH